MKKFIRYALATSTLLLAMPAQADCPTLTSQALGEILFPVSGLQPFDHNGVTYQRKSDFSIKGIAKNLWAGVRKQLRDDNKNYTGVESELKPGKLVCNYDLPENWKKQANINEFRLTADIRNPIPHQLAVCPKIKFSDISNLTCGGTLADKNDRVIWSTSQNHEEGLLSKACKLASAVKNQITGVESTHEISGKYGDETKAFSHTCKYEYHIGSKPETLVLYGKMDLEKLRKAVAQTTPAAPHVMPHRSE